MAVADDIKEWWTGVLLNQTKSAHPVFGSDIDVQIDGDIVILRGTVESPEQIEELEREARSIGFVQTVVNRLRVTPGTAPRYHMQTVVATFKDRSSALLASRSVTAAKIYPSGEPRILERGHEAEAALLERAAAAKVGRDGVRHYLNELRAGKVVLTNRVPEDDALRIISALEGSQAESIETLPPEPDSLEEP